MNWFCLVYISFWIFSFSYIEFLIFDFKSIIILQIFGFGQISISRRYNHSEMSKLYYFKCPIIWVAPVQKSSWSLLEFRTRGEDFQQWSESTEAFTMIKVFEVKQGVWDAACVVGWSTSELVHDIALVCGAKVPFSIAGHPTHDTSRVATPTAWSPTRGRNLLETWQDTLWFPTRGRTRKKLRTVILKVCVFRFLIGSELLESFVAHHKTKMNHRLDDGMKLGSVEVVIFGKP